MLGEIQDGVVRSLWEDIVRIAEGEDIVRAAEEAIVGVAGKGVVRAAEERVVRGDEKSEEAKERQVPCIIKTIIQFQLKN